MRYLWLFAAFLITQDAIAQTINVTDVKVSVTADSSATAREQALEQAHTLAFQKLLKENFPEKSGPLPSQDTLMNMVTNFSIDREKTTSTKYTASLTFQFDGPQVYAWTQQGRGAPQQPFPSQNPLQAKGDPSLNIGASFTTLTQWQHIKRTLENIPGVYKITVRAFSPQNAKMDVAYGGDIEKLKQQLLQQGLLLSPLGDTWSISSTTPSIG